MNMKSTAKFLLAAVCSLCLATVAMAGDIQEAASRALDGVDSDDAKAVKLVETARLAGTGDEVAVGLLRLAIDYAMKSADSGAGLQAGIDALDSLGRKSPDQAVYCRSKLDQLCQGAYRRAKPQDQAGVAADVMKRIEASGDASAADWRWPDAQCRYTIAMRMAGLSGHTQVPLDHKCRMANYFVTAFRKLAPMKAARDKGVESAGGRLAVFYLTALNDPARAALLLAPDSSEALRTYVPLASKNADELQPEALNQLCDWYSKSLATKAEDFGREMLLRKAIDYAEKARSKRSGKSDPDRITPLEEQLARYSYVNRMLARSRSLDLLAMTDIDRDASKGKWQFADNAFVTKDVDYGSLKMPVNVEGSYQLSLQLAKTKSAKDIYVSFPVGDRQIRLHLEEHKPWPFGAWGGRKAAGRKAGGRDGRVGRLVDRFARKRGIDPNAIWLRAELSGLGRDEGSRGDREINPQYDKRTWVPYSIDIAVKVDGGKAAVGVTVGAVHKLKWSGQISSLAEEDVESTPITVRFAKAGLAVRSVRLSPRGGTVGYAFADCPGPVPPAPAADEADRLGEAATQPSL